MGRLAADDVRLWAQDGYLHYDGPADVLPAPVLGELRTHREEILSQLAHPEVRTVPAGTEHARMWRSISTVPHPEVWTNAYYTATAVRIDLGILRHALADVVARHESLRCGFADQADGRLMLSVHRAAAGRVELLDAAPEEATDAQRLHDRCLRFAAEPLDLAAPPLLRLGVVRRDRGGEPDDVLVLAVHHLISDGVTLEILGAELGACYRSRLRGESPELPVPQSYVGFLEQERQWLTTESATAVEERAAQLAGAVAVLTFPPAPDADPDSVDNVSFTTLDEEESALFTLACQLARVSEFAVMLAALNVLATEVTGESDYVLAVSAACRTPEYAETVGLVRRHLPVRLRAEADDSWADLARRCLDALGDALDYPLLSLDAVRDQWMPQVSAEFPQLVVTHLPEMELGVDLGAGLALWEECPMPGARAGIGMIMRSDAGRVSGGFEVAGSIAGPETRQRWLDRYARLLVEAAQDMDAPIPSARRAGIASGGTA
nr:condensation domain-containing protein [Streptomyces sp. SID12501]